MIPKTMKDDDNHAILEFSVGENVIFKTRGVAPSVDTAGKKCKL